MTAAIAAESLGPELVRLLAENQLPTADLPVSPAHFFTARADGHLLGLVGLEPRGDGALLRSLAVARAARGLGIGTGLVRHAERAAASANLRAVYLLTTTAGEFFAALGYEPLPRSDAPTGIASTAEFSSLCPDTSAFMYKKL
ncbi:MAG: GNAT family N-acetyltransferase [Proteobacteria bacterium]|nr:GNAT family N-acetyltransferase [Pseudomonadota bacterium]